MHDETPAVSTGSHAETHAFVRGGASGSLAVRCPECRAPTNLGANASLVSCSSCGFQFSLASDTHDAGAGEAPATLGRFHLSQRLGVGGFGAVWKARDKELDRTVAIKIPHRGVVTSDDAEKFLREARAAAQLRHPNIVSVHEVGRDGANLFIVSDFVAGATLDDWPPAKQLTSREAAALCVKIADALHHAHEHGVIHRDLKPANILMDEAGEPHLTDFGLARREAGDATLTIEGDVLGTPAYMSPEQAGGSAHAADRRSDVYSLAVILFEILTGEAPFRGNPRMLVHQVLNDPPPSPRKFNGAIPKDLETITLKGLEKDPSRRFDGAREMGDELRRFLAGQPILARPVGRVERCWRLCRRHPQIAALSGLLLAALIAGAAIAAWQAMRFRQERDRAEESLALAEQAVQSYLTKVAEDERLSEAGFHQLRAELLETAVPFYEKFAALKPGDAQGEAERAGAYARLATIRSEVGESRQSVGQFEQAIAILDALVARFPERPNYQQQLAKFHQGAGWNLLLIGDLDAGQAHYSHALEILQKLVARYPSDPSYRLSLAEAQQGYGLVLRDREPPAARKQFDLAVHSLDALVRQQPGAAGYERSLAESCFYLGHLLRRTEPDAAYRYLERAERLQRNLAAQTPQEPEYPAALAETLAAQAYVLSAKQRMPAAAEKYREAIELQTKVVNEHPNVVKYRVIMAGVISERGGHLARLKDHAGAAVEYARFAEIYDELSHQFLTMRKYHRNAASGHSYAAFYYFLAGQTEKSLTHREQAEEIRRQFPQYFSRLELASQGTLWQRAATFMTQLQSAGGVPGIVPIQNPEPLQGEDQAP